MAVGIEPEEDTLFLNRAVFPLDRCPLMGDPGLLNRLDMLSIHDIIKNRFGQEELHADRIYPKSFGKGPLQSFRRWDMVF
jgi:hypothetical protein